MRISNSVRQALVRVTNSIPVFEQFQRLAAALGNLRADVHELRLEQGRALHPVGDSLDVSPKNRAAIQGIDLGAVNAYGFHSFAVRLFGQVNRLPGWDGAGPAVTLGNGDALCQSWRAGGRLQAFQPVIYVNLAGALGSQAGSLLYLLPESWINHGLTA